MRLFFIIIMLQMRLRDIHKEQHEESQEEDAHSEEKSRGSIGNSGTCRIAYHSTDKHGNNSGTDRVTAATYLQ